MTTNAKILLAEDDAIAARHLNQSLLRMGYQLTGAVKTGEDVIENVAENQPDIILMDITLGGKIDGICAVQKVHALFDTPVIYLTASSDNEVFERAKLTELGWRVLLSIAEDAMLANGTMASMDGQEDER